MQVLEDSATAPISEHLKAVLPFLRKITRTHADVSPDDVRPLFALGISRSKLEDALDVGWCFNVITRLADTFEFEVGPQASFDTSAKMLLKRGYKL